MGGFRARRKGGVTARFAPSHASIIRALLEAGELDRLSITLCPELPGGGERLFGDGPAGSSWSLTSISSTDSGAICLLYDRVRD